MNSERSLRDVGERFICESILPAYVHESLSDCAVLSVSQCRAVVTTDPVPTPAASLLGGDPDLYWLGWLLVVINASDLAAAAAKPLGFVAAIELPDTTSVAQLERLLLGVSESCVRAGLTYVGGNLKEGPRVHAVGTAIGELEHGRVLTRSGARDGDRILSIGTGGRFWKDVLDKKSGRRPIDKTTSPLFSPVARIDEMRVIAQFVNASIDNSDGLLPSLQQLAAASGVSIMLDLDRLTVPDSPTDIDAARLWLGWGDWNVLVSVGENDVERVEADLRTLGYAAEEIGVVANGSGVCVMRKGHVKVAPRLESERFSADSWFATGPDAYLQALRKVELP